MERRLQEDGVDLDALEPGHAASGAVRDAVIAVRRGKSMVLDASDPNARSAGSFFLNPTLSDVQLESVKQRWRERGEDPASMPVFPAAGGLHKVAAAWLVEQSGFKRGRRLGAAGISEKHALALVSHGDSTADLLALAAEVVAAVDETFGVALEQEPVYVPKA